MTQTQAIKKTKELIKVRDLLIEFGSGRKKVKAVKGATFDVHKGETFGLIGESGSGKTTVGRAIMGIQPITDGTIYFNNQVAYGESPDLYKLNKKTMKNLEKMRINQSTTTLRLSSYLEEFKRVSYKYLESKYYDLHSKEIRDYDDGISRIIPEGVNLKDTKLGISKKDTNLGFVNEAVADNLKRLLKIIRMQQRTIRFIDGISAWIDIDKEVEIALVNQQNKTHDLILQIKELENQIYISLAKISNLKNDAIEGKFTSIKKFFKEFGNELKKIISLHKTVSQLLKETLEEQFFNLAIISTKKDRSKYKLELIKLIAKDKIENKSKNVKKIEYFLKISGLENVQEQMLKSDIFKLPDKTHKRNLKKEMQMIFQDPASSLNDRMAIEEIIGEGLDNFPELYKNDDSANAYIEWFNEAQTDENRKITIDDIKWKDVKHFLILQLLTTVGMLPEHLSRYPHEFSGGQRQRVGIARALIMKPKFIVADEPISALDVSIRAQVMNLLAKFQKEFDLTYVFISHDLSVVRFVADRIAIIYRGDIVELADANELFINPLHPYTKSLLSAVPLPDPEQERKKVHFKYEPEKEHFDYLLDFPKWIEIKKGHFVYANDREISEYKKYLKSKK